MGPVGTSNLATLLGSQSRGAAIRTELDRAQIELSTGRVTSLIEATKGDPQPLYGIESRLSTVQADLDAVTIGQTRLDSAEAALDQIATLTDSFGPEFANAVSGLIPGEIETASRRAGDILEDVIGVLNIAPGGRALFGGASVDGPVLDSSTDLLDALRTALTGSTDIAADIEAFFFDTAGPFETTIWNGADPALPARTSLGGDVPAPPVANDPALKDVLTGLSAAFLSSDPAFAADAAVTAELQAVAETALLNSRGSLTGLRERLGIDQAQLALLDDRLTAESTALTTSRNEIIAADPYETATWLNALEAQLDAFYTVTARQSALSFTRYLG